MSQDSKIEIIQEMIDTAEESLRKAKQMLAEVTGGKVASKQDYTKNTQTLNPSISAGDEKIIEGVFDGERMLDKDDNEYAVPANYASKSKLIPGDILKLTIKEDGGYLYKQIGPAERRRIVGTLTYEDGQYRVIAEGQAYKVLLASVTYFRGEVGDKVTLIVPALEESEWGAIENILPKDDHTLEAEQTQ